MKSPWVSRRDLDATVEFYENYVGELQDRVDELDERVRYLERERESHRLASLTPEPTPITVLDKHDEDVARWEADGGA